MSFPPMLTLAGQVINVYANPTGVDKKTGEQFGGGFRVQLHAVTPLSNGENKMEIVTLGTDVPDLFKSLSGRWCRVPVRVWANNGAWGFSVVKGAAPVPLEVKQ